MIGIHLRAIDPATASEANTIAIDGSGAPAWIEGSVPLIPLPFGSDASDVPAGTPVGAFIMVPAS